MVFAQKVLAPGPSTPPKATFRWCPFQSALSGSWVFQASTSGGGYDFILVNLRFCRGDPKSLTFPGCLSRGPGARVWGSKSIGRVIPVPGGWDRLPVQQAARSGDRPVAPTRTKPSTVLWERLADPAHEMEGASWFLNPRPLPLGLAPGQGPPSDLGN